MSTWFITGASSGLGRAIAENAVTAGHQVVATARNTSTLADLVAGHPEQVIVLPLDVTDPGSREAAVAEAERRLGGIDVLVNNAGYGYTAAVEEGEDDAVERLFATNFFGPAALVQAALPGMRRRGSGTIVNVSSVGARVPIPGGGWYSAAKAALEGLSGALRKEVEPFGLHVVIVEPGSFRTDFRGRSAERSTTTIDAYDAVLGRTGDAVLSPQRGEPDKAAAAIVHAVDGTDVPRLLVLGTDALEGYQRSAQADADDVAAFEHLTRSTDATS